MKVSINTKNGMIESVHIDCSALEWCVIRILLQNEAQKDTYNVEKARTILSNIEEVAVELEEKENADAESID